MSRGIMMMLFITFVCVIGCSRFSFYECAYERNVKIRMKRKDKEGSSDFKQLKLCMHDR